VEWPHLLLEKNELFASLFSSQLTFVASLSSFALEKHQKISELVQTIAE